MESDGTNRGRGGRKPALNAQHVETLRAITREQPRSSLEEVTRELHRRTGAEVCTATVRKALRQAGIDRVSALPCKAGHRGASGTRTPIGARTAPAA